MTDYMAAMLDELMGAGRNARGDEKAAISFENADVCKEYLVDFCTHDIFRNTKNDMGYCPLRHDNNMKKAYDESARKGKLGYEDRFLEHISDLDREVRRKIEKNERRLNITQAGGTTEDGANKVREQNEERKKEISKKIDEKMEEAAKAGGAGNVNLAQSLVTEADKLREEQELIVIDGARALERFHQVEDIANSLNKPMKVCQICGCFMLVNDAQSRIDDHFAGKLHLAYAKIRETIEAMKTATEERRAKMREETKRRDEEREKERKERDKERKSEKSDKSDKSDRKDRDRERSDRDRKRSRSPRDRSDRDRRDRDRDHRDSGRRSDDRRRDDRDRDRRIPVHSTIGYRTTTTSS